MILFKKGDTDTPDVHNVKKWQEWLLERGGALPHGANGIYDDETVAAVQAVVGFGSDGQQITTGDYAYVMIRDGAVVGQPGPPGKPGDKGDPGPPGDAAVLAPGTTLIIQG